MLLPRFTIRFLMAITVVAALVAWVLQQAVAGSVWALCAGWTLVFVIVLFGAYAALFLLSWGIGQALGFTRATYTPVATPFAMSPVVAAEVLVPAEEMPPVAAPVSTDQPPPSHAP